MFFKARRSAMRQVDKQSDKWYAIKKGNLFLKSEEWEWVPLGQDVGFWHDPVRAEFHLAEYEDRLKGAKVVEVVITKIVEYAA
jgi:hypothetical protein